MGETCLYGYFWGYFTKNINLNYSAKVFHTSISLSNFTAIYIIFLKQQSILSQILNVP